MVSCILSIPKNKNKIKDTKRVKEKEFDILFTLDSYS